jgi:hypothetical protein
VVVYFDDILICSKSLDEHIEYLCAVFGALCEARLFSNLEKCTFCTNRVTFIGYVVTSHGINVDEVKIEDIKSWLIHTTLTQLLHKSKFLHPHRQVDSSSLLQLLDSVRLLSSNVLQVELVLEACYFKKITCGLLE